MILSHITRAPFPLLHSMWLWSIVGVIDAQLPFLFDR
jgi:ethanolaminephosphotransferase